MAWLVFARSRALVPLGLTAVLYHPVIVKELKPLNAEAPPETNPYPPVPALPMPVAEVLSKARSLRWPVTPPPLAEWRSVATLEELKKLKLGPPPTPLAEVVPVSVKVYCMTNV